MAIDEQRLLREHYEILSDIKAIKEDIKTGKATNRELILKLEELEKRAIQTKRIKLHKSGIENTI